MRVDLRYVLIAFMLITPHLYLFWQGRASERLIDTTNVDRTVRWFYLVSVFGLITYLMLGVKDLAR